MKELCMNNLENVSVGGVNKAIAVACAGVVVADTLWWLGVMVPTYGGVLVAANIGCAAYGLVA